MIKALVPRSPSINSNRAFSVLLVVALLLPFLVTAPAPDVPARAQPILLQMAAERPEETVGVIVQKLGKDTNVEDLVSRLGGVVTKDLWIINAFAAELPAKAVPKLARAAGVRWVSLDAPVMNSLVPTCGGLLQEAEQGSLYGNFTVGQDSAASGGQYIHAPEGTGSFYDGLIPDHRAEFCFNVPTAGTYQIQGWIYAADGSSDSFYVKVDGSPTAGYEWHTNQNASYLAEYVDNDGTIIEEYLSAGEHTITIFVREDGTRLDRLELVLVDGGSSGGSETVRDEFNAVSFSNNDGTQVWVSDWVEDDPAGGGAGPTAGQVQIVDGALRLDDCWDTGGEPSAARKVDLSGGCTTATFSFDFRTSWGVDWDDAVAVEVSSDGGANYTVLETITGISGATSGSRSFDILGFISAETTIRFRVSSKYGADNEYFFADDVQIEYEGGGSEPTPTPTSTPGSPPSGGTGTVRDEFNAISFSGNDGTANWSGDWAEIGESNGPSYGDVEITSNQLRIEDDYRGLQRMVDLSAATSAVLSFEYRRSSFDSESDYVAIEISADGGASWTELGRFAGPGSDSGMQSASYDIFGYVSSNTAIRFASSSSLGSYDKLYIDNVQIEYTAGGGDEPTPTPTPVPATPTPTPGPPPSVGDENTYLDTLGARQVWDMGVQGQGITVAVIDSGVSYSPDFGTDAGGDRLLAQVALSSNATTAADIYGHGTHVAGIIAGNGSLSNGAYVSIAPQANLIGLRISDDTGMAYESDTVEAMQWVLTYKDVHNIRVVNLSVNSTLEQSYHLSPLTAATEILWFNGIVVVASVGNKGPAGGYNTANTSPANDPFIITVGAADEHDTSDRSDDSQAPFSSHGTTVDGFYRPDILAPGYNIISVLSSDSSWDVEHPDRVLLNGSYIRLSGTSMAAPMVAGAAALLLQDEPNLTPAQVKYRLLHTGSLVGETPYLNVYAAVTGTANESANVGIRPHDLLCKSALIAFWASENGGDDIDWGSVNWDSVNWDSVNWDSVNWDSVNWD